MASTTTQNKTTTPLSPTDRLSADVSEWDERTYRDLISEQLTEEQIGRIAEPDSVYERQRSVLAVHWHPEFVPMDIVRRRIDAMFPNRREELIIPTQHNVLMNYDGYAGVEVDCFSRSFNLKVQLLVHFEAARVDSADVFKAMLAHTFRYRSHQLFEFIDTVIEPAFAERFEKAVDRSGADEMTADFVRTATRKLRQLVTAHESITPAQAIRNKLLMNYVGAHRTKCDGVLVGRAEALLREVKRIVKAHFSNEFFYHTEEIIEEVRGLGGGIIIPHPEQFWPILLAEYDVDGYEVWNPQSQEYTDFLIHVVSRQNKTGRRRRPLLILMGDDCHMGEKVKDPRLRDREKAAREIGVQPAWDDLNIRKSLITAGANRSNVIEAYKARLAG